VTVVRVPAVPVTVWVLVALTTTESMTVGTLLAVSEAIEADATAVPLPWNLVPVRVRVRVREDEESVGITVLETVMVPESSTVPVETGSEEAITSILVKVVGTIVVEFENRTVGCAEPVELAATVGTTMRVLALLATEETVGWIVMVVVENLRRRRVTVVVM
jgi:hypothetical protein